MDLLLLRANNKYIYVNKYIYLFIYLLNTFIKLIY